MDRAIITPRIVGKSDGTRLVKVGGENGYPDGSNTFLAGNFLVLSSGDLAALATDAVLAGAFATDDSKSSTTIDPPYALIGDKHFPFKLNGVKFAISVTDDSENIGEANSAPQLSEISVGSSYGILKGAAGLHYLNVDETSNTIFTVVEKPEQFDGVFQTAATYNPVVIVQVIASKIQTLG